MKKTLGTLVCVATLICGAAQAEASTLYTNWAYNLESVVVTYGEHNENTSIASEDVDVAGKFSWIGGYTSSIVTAQPPNPDSGTITLSGDASSGTGSFDKTGVLGQTTNVLDSGSNPSSEPNYLATFAFSYTAQALNADGDPVDGLFFDITYSIPFYTYYDAVQDVDYVYYNNNDVGTTGRTTITGSANTYSYSISGVHLFVDGRALVGANAKDSETSVGWAINDDTRNNNYAHYGVGGQYFLLENGEEVWYDNETAYLGEKTNKGSFQLSGNFDISYKLENPVPNPTPEPATMLLMGLGLAGLGFVARRRNK